MACAEQARAAGEGERSAWVRRRLSHSVYLWACGEKANDDDDDYNLSDGLIGWLILFLQGFAYAVLIALTRTAPESGTNSSADDTQSGYLLPSVTGGMYLLVASTTHDLHAGFSLLVDGSCSGHRLFGIGLLTVYGIMVTAAMTVLVSTSADSASVVLNAVTVLCIADLDEKALQFLSTVPQRWRLFWAIQTMAASFVFALVAIVHLGDSSALMEGSNRILKECPTWAIWGVNPAALTFCSFLLSSFLQCVCESCSQEYEGIDRISFRSFSRRIYVGILAPLKRAKEGIVSEPVFVAVLSTWYGELVVLWLCMKGRRDRFPIAFSLIPRSSAGEGERWVVTQPSVVLLYPTALLITGLIIKARTTFLQRHGRLTAVADPRNLYEGDETSDTRACYAERRLSSLLVGWGVGYWVTSVVHVLLLSWHGGGWINPPTGVRLVAYIVIPCFSLVGIFMAADSNMCGTRLEEFIKPAVDRMRDSRRVEYWVMVTFLRNLLFAWVAFCVWITIQVSVITSFDHNT